MTPAERSALADEMNSGPLAAQIAPLAESAQDDAIAALLNAPSADAYGKVERADFAVWCGSTGLRSVVEDHAATAASPLRSIALTTLDLLRGAVAGSVDFALAGNQQMLGAWVAAGGCTQAQADALLAMSARKVSRAEIVLGRAVTADEVGRAR